MPRPEPEATLQATASLSPVSPSPVHSAAPLVVPALQHTVDTIDAMVVAVAAAAAGADDRDFDSALAPAGETDDVVDDDSFNDAYGDEADDRLPEPPQQEPADSNDDYAKTFDSPIGPEEGEGHVSSIPRESHDASLSSDRLTSRPSDVSHVAPDSSAVAMAMAITPAASSPSATQPEADAEPGNAASSQPADLPAAAVPSASPQPTSGGGSAEQASRYSPLDIQQLVADLTAQPAESSAGNPDPAASSLSTAPAAAPAASSSLPPTALPSSSSLPPRPPLPQAAPQSYASQHHPPGSNSTAAPSTLAAGASGTAAEALGNLPPPAAIASINAPPYPSNPPGYSTDRAQDVDYQRQWDQFMTDERQYMSEAKWDRFPEGSRIFIGNLSSDKVSKRDVFDIFHRFGRLAQISLKSAYGFVQYHTVDEGRRALENLQSMEVKGRRIHLEISRLQDKSKKDRNRSPDRPPRSGRDGGRDGGRRNEKYGRDDNNRSGRNHSPRRNDHYGRNDGYGRDRGYHDSGRARRSRSPAAYGRNEKDFYRRRSHSPYGGRPRHDEELDLPRRYGADVPDVQIIMQPDVSRDFGTWVEGAFRAKGLKTNVMYIHPRFPKDQVVQRQAAEGVHGVIDLDLRAQGLGKIPVHSFDRSGGIHNVRFEQYVDLEPNTAAEVILRAKASGAANYNQAYGGGYPPHQYGAQPPMPPHAPGFPGMQQPGAYPHQPAPAAADIASLIGQVDNNTLQRLLSTIQPAAPQGMMAGAHSGHAHGGPKVAPDIHAILGSLNGNSAPQHHAPHSQAPQYGGAYGAQQAAVQAGVAAQVPGGAAGDTTAQVQNIMAQLARYR